MEVLDGHKEEVEEEEGLEVELELEETTSVTIPCKELATMSFSLSSIPSRLHSEPLDSMRLPLLKLCRLCR